MTALEIVLLILVVLLSLAVWFFWKRMLYWHSLAQMWEHNYKMSAAYRPSLISSIAPILVAYVAGLFIGKKYLGSADE